MLTTVETANRIMADIRTGLRPYLSLRGPKKTCPTAKPSILVAKPSWTRDGVVLKISAIDGNVGRYISVTNGPKADSIPRNVIRKTKYFLLKVAVFVIVVKSKTGAKLMNIFHCRQKR